MRSQPHLLLAALAVLLVVGCNETGTDSDDVDGVTVGFTPNEITFKESGELKELLDDKLVFVDSQGQEWVAPKGTLTDGASVPRLALWITDGRFDSRFLKAAIVHDAYCQGDNQTRCPEQFRKRPWKAVHRMFFEACLAGGTPETTANLMFAGVWLGGPPRGHSLARVASANDIGVVDQAIAKTDTLGEPADSIPQPVPSEVRTQPSC